MTTTDLCEEKNEMHSVNTTTTTKSMRQIIEKRKEKERLEDEANYTFKPKVKDLKKNQTQREKENSSSTFDKLYSDAVKKNLKEKEKPKASEFPFKPYITNKGTSSRGSSRERTYSITRPKTAPNGIPANNPDPEARFHPTISRRALSIERDCDSRTCDRLYLQSKVLKEKYEKVQKEKVAAELDECTFSPRLPRTSRSTSSSRSASNEPRYDPTFPDRQKRYDQTRNKKIQELVQAKAKNELKDVTFHPQLSKGTRRLSAGIEKSSVPLYERLNSAVVGKDNSLIAAEVNAENTFQPQLATKFRSSASLSPLRMPMEEQMPSIHERLYKLGELKQRESEQERQLILEMMKKQTTFKPKINATSSRDREDEAYVPVFERLSSTGDNKVLMDEVLTKIKAEIELRGCTFQPQMLTKKKQQPATPQPQDPPVPVVRPTVHVRLSMEAEVVKAQQAKKATQKLTEDLMNSALSFAPQLPDQSVEIARRRNLVLNVITGTDHHDVYSRLANQ